jgi:hypothetical protein
MAVGLKSGELFWTANENLTVAARLLAAACPSLRLITFCMEGYGICLQYAPLADDIEEMEPLDEVSDELDGKPIRFWLPPQEMEVVPGRHRGYCAPKFQQPE